MLELIEIYGIHDISANIYKSSFINIDILQVIYDRIISSDRKQINIMLNNLFIKVVQYNIGKEICEKEIEKYLDTINIEGYENHSCPYNYHNFIESPCEFSIFKSFANCLYFYVNDIHIAYNKNISDTFAEKYLSPDNLKKFKENIVKVESGYNMLYSEKLITKEDIEIDIDTIYEGLKTDKNKYSKLLSINNNLLWDSIISTAKNNINIDIDYLFINKFEKQVKKIRNESIYYWQAKCKVENWLFKCYWDPRSSL